MVLLRARNPLIFASAAALVVVTGATFLAPHLVPQQHAQGELIERVSVAHSIASGTSYANVPLGGAVANNSVSNPSASHTSLAQPLIARTGDITLLVYNVDGVIEAVGRMAKSRDGVVFGLNATNDQTTDSSATADMSIRIPATYFDETMSKLARLGTVQSREVKAEDLTANITDSDARLRNLRRTESDMLGIMDRSGNVSQIMDAEDKISSVREQIETLESDLKSMNGRVAYSSIDIHLAAEVNNKPAEPTAANQLTNAFGSAVHALSQTTIGLLSTVIWLLVFAPYPLAVAALVWVIWRALHLRKHAVRS